MQLKMRFSVEQKAEDDLNSLIMTREEVAELKGERRGERKMKEKKDKEFVLSLLQNTAYTVEEIAKLVKVPIKFVQRVKMTIIEQ